jgi:hypothetical protein
MILAPLALVLLATTQPAPRTLPQTQSPVPVAVVATRVSLRDAAMDAARRSAARLEQAPILRHGGTRGLSYGTHKRAVAIALGLAAGFVGGIVIGIAPSHGECPPPLWVVMSTTAAGGAAGWALTRP